VSEHEPGRTVYRSVNEFVENYLSLLYQRDVRNGRYLWCPQWWKHIEAVIRLDALWRSWEHYRLISGTGMSVWLLGHADPHMQILFDPEGPFQHCSVRNGHRDVLQPLPLQEAPPEIFGLDLLTDEPGKKSTTD
jgi:hypothetical protein